MSTSSQALFELETLFIEKLQEKYKLNLRDIKKAFARFDLDHNGLLDLDELAGGISLFLNGVKPQQLQELVARYDTNGDGKISYEEFLHFLQTRCAIDTTEPEGEAEAYDDLPRSRQARDTYEDRLRRSDHRQGEDRSQLSSRGSGYSGQSRSTYDDRISDEAVDYYDDGELQVSYKAQQRPQQRPGTAQSDTSVLDVQNPQALQDRAQVFLDNLRASLNRTAADMRLGGKVAQAKSLKLPEVQYKVGRELVLKAFQPYTGHGTHSRITAVVDFGDFSRVLRKYSFPGCPPLRTETLHYLYTLCCDELAGPGGSGVAVGASVEAFLSLLFPSEPVAVAQAPPATAKQALVAPDVGAANQGAGVKAAMHGGAAAAGTGKRPNVRHGRTTLPLPHTFDPSCVARSQLFPQYTLARRHVFGMATTRYSNQPFYVLPAPAEGRHQTPDPTPRSRSKDFLDRATIVYASAALGVVHDLSTHTQSFMHSLIDDVTCVAVSRCGRYVAAGCVGKKASVHVWEVRRDGAGDSTTCVCVLGQGSQPASVQTEEDVIARGVNCVEFSCDNAFVFVVGCDDNHMLGIYEVASASRVASLPAQHGIPPMLKWLAVCPSVIHTDYISREHAGACHVFASAGEHHLRVWSFRAPTRGGKADASALVFKQLTLSSTKTGLRTPKAFTCTAFIPCDDGSYDILTGGSSGVVYLHRGGTLIAHQPCIRLGRIHTVAVHPADHKLCAVAGARGICCLLDSRTLNVLRRIYVLGSSVAGALTVAQTRGIAKIDAANALKRVAARPKSASRPRPGSANKGPARPLTPAGAAGKPVPRRSADDTVIPSGAVRAELDDDDDQAGGTSAAPYVSGLQIIAGGGRGGAGGSYMLASTSTGKFVRVDLPMPIAASNEAHDAKQVCHDLLHFHAGPVYGLAMDANMQSAFQTSAATGAPMIVATSGDDRQLLVWDLASRLLLARAVLPEVCRCVDIDKTNSFLCLGGVSGAIHIYYISDKMTAQSIYLVESLTMRKDAGGEVTCVSFSPSNALVALGSRDGCVYVYSIRLSLSEVGRGRDVYTQGECILRLVHRLKGHSSSVTHLDWSFDSQVLRTTCAAYELLHWDVAAGRQETSSTTADVRWKTQRCVLGAYVTGIWPLYSDGTDINAVDTNMEKGLIFTANDVNGELRMLNYPCMGKHAPANVYTGHSSHVMNVRVNKEGSHVVTAGGNDGSVMLFDLLPAARDGPRESVGFSK